MSGRREPPRAQLLAYDDFKKQILFFPENTVSDIATGAIISMRAIIRQFEIQRDRTRVYRAQTDRPLQLPNITSTLPLAINFRNKKAIRCIRYITPAERAHFSAALDVFIEHTGGGPPPPAAPINVSQIAQSVTRGVSSFFSSTLSTRQEGEERITRDEALQRDIDLPPSYYDILPGTSRASTSQSTRAVIYLQPPILDQNPPPVYLPTLSLNNSINRRRCSF